jgi:hypothetical protein
MEMQLSPKMQAKFQDALTGGVVSRFFNFFMGRCTFAAIVFSVIGVVGWLQGRDLTSYALFVTAIQGLLVLHSWKSDIAEQKAAQLQQQNVNVVVQNAPTQQ